MAEIISFMGQIVIVVFLFIVSSLLVGTAIILCDNFVKFFVSKKPQKNNKKEGKKDGKD